jgi:hypothetical protein
VPENNSTVCDMKLVEKECFTVLDTFQEVQLTIANINLQKHRTGGVKGNAEITALDFSRVQTDISLSEKKTKGNQCPCETKDSQGVYRPLFTEIFGK